MILARVTSLEHVSIIYMIELSDEQQSNIFWATEYFDKKNQQILIKELLQQSQSPNGPNAAIRLWPEISVTQNPNYSSPEEHCQQ